jgi:hypothetical protein
MSRFEGRFMGSRWGTVSRLPGVQMAEDEKTGKPWSFDLKALLAAVSLVATVIFQLSDKHPTETKVLLGLTIFLVAASYYTPLKLQAVRLLEHKRDDAVAKNALSKFREFVHRFGEFMDNRRNDGACTD